MTIGDVKQYRILPFEYDDPKLHSLFSFFLHSAPTINCAGAAKIDDARLESNWDYFIENYWKCEKKRFYTSEFPTSENVMKKHMLHDKSVIAKQRYAFLCLKNANETDVACFLRHLRNAIAHGHVYVYNPGNKKYIIFEDFKNKKLSAIIYVSQTLLLILKKSIMR